MTASAIRSICLNQEAWNEALERHSEALHIGRCGGRAVWHERDISKIRFVAIDVNRILEAHRARAKLKRSAGGVNARRPCGTHGRSAAESVDAAEHRGKIHNAMGERLQSNQGKRCDARSTTTSPSHAADDRAQIAADRAFSCALHVRSD